MRAKQMKRKDFIIERENKMKEKKEKIEKLPRLPERTRREVIDTLKHDIAFAESGSRFGYPVELAKALLWAYEERVLNNDEVIVEYPANRDIVVLKVFCEVCGHCELIPMTKNTLKDYVRSGTPYDRWRPNSDCYEISCGIESPLVGLQDMLATRMCAFCRSRSGVNDWTTHASSEFETLQPADVCVVRNRLFPMFGKGAFGGSDDPMSEVNTAVSFSESLEHLDGRLVIVERDSEDVRIGGVNQFITSSSVVRCGYIEQNVWGDKVGYREIIVPTFCLEPFRYWQSGKYTVFDEGDSFAVYDYVLMELSLDGADYKFKKKELMRVHVQDETEQSRRAAITECRKFLCKRFLGKDGLFPCSDDMCERVWRDLAQKNGGRIDDFFRFDKVLPETGVYEKHTMNGHLIPKRGCRDSGLKCEVFTKLRMKVDKEFSVSSLNREKSLFFSDGRVLYLPKEGDEFWWSRYHMCGTSPFRNQWVAGRLLGKDEDGKFVKCVVDRVYSHAFVAWDRRECDVKPNLSKCRACKVDESANGLSEVGVNGSRYVDDVRTVRVNYPSISYHLEYMDDDLYHVRKTYTMPLELIFHANRNVGCKGVFKVEKKSVGGFDVVDKETGKVFTSFCDKEDACDFVRDKENLVDTSKFDLHTARNSMCECN